MIDQLGSQEETRQELQAEIDNKKNPQDRNKLGQYATPSKLANDIVRCTLKYVGSTDGISFLEPSIGSGSFYSALLHNLNGTTPDYALGVEIDKDFADASSKLWKNHGIEIMCADFTKLNPTTLTKKANLVIANPPYVRHHHIDINTKQRLQAQAEAILSHKVSGLSGLYVYFLLLTHAWLLDGAISTWLIPTEWMDVNYGHALRSYLTKKVSLLRIHKFSAEDVQFSDALVSSSVVIFKKTPPKSGHECHFTSGPSITKPLTNIRIPIDALAKQNKWNSLFSQSTYSIDLSSIELGSLFTIKRGLATGCNNFFIRTYEDFQRMGIPDIFLKPILPPIKKLGPGNTVLTDKEGIPLIDKPLAIFNCKLNEQHLKEKYPSVFNLIQSTEAAKIKKGYLLSRRSPWYSQESRPDADIVCTYMGRLSKTQASPFRFLLNLSNATVSNSYLILSLKREYLFLQKEDPSFLRNVVEQLNNLSSEEIVRYGRVYGGGLYKLEPKELAHVPLQNIKITKPPIIEDLKQTGFSI